MTSQPESVRRNSFRNLTEVQYLDVTIGRVQDVTREKRHGADHIVTEFAAGTLIVSEDEMRRWVGILIALGVASPPRHLAAADCSGSYWPADDLGDDPDGDNT